MIPRRSSLRDRPVAGTPGPRQKRIADAHVTVSLVRGSAEQLPFADAVFDTLVMTWTLCSIPNPSAALAKMRRVLKPDGRLLFVEHGKSPEPRVVRWQGRLTPYWKRISGGCHLDRKMDDLIRAANSRSMRSKRAIWQVRNRGPLCIEVSNEVGIG